MRPRLGIARVLVQARAMPLNTEHLFLISPELGNQFILISILMPREPACQAHSVAFQVELLEPRSDNRQSLGSPGPAKTPVALWLALPLLSTRRSP
jgi:hypothetical protein